MGFRRTTVVLEEGLYRQVKQLAVDQDKTLREVIQKALQMFCQGRLFARRRIRMPRFGAYRFRVKGSLRRADIYEDRV